MRYIAIYTIILLLIFGKAQPVQGETIQPKELTKAVYLIKSGDHELAIAFCCEALEENPDLTQAYYLRGYAYFQMNQYKKAIEDFDQTLQRNPEYADAYYYRGISYRKEGKIWSSARDLKKANDLNPSSTQSSLFVELFKSIF
ncbi:MAG: tetratricopeptide repeat protein [Bacteroidota bacterium]